VLTMIRLVVIRRPIRPGTLKKRETVKCTFPSYKNDLNETIIQFDFYIM
jgi:hypothetical protein